MCKRVLIENHSRCTRKMRLWLGAGFVGFVLKQTEFAQWDLHDVPISYVLCIEKKHRVLRTLSVWERCDMDSETTVWWYGASNHTLWNQQYQDWEHLGVYHKYLLLCKPLCQPSRWQARIAWSNETRSVEYAPVNETWSGSSDQVTVIMINLLYTNQCLSKNLNNNWFESICNV